MLSRSELKDTCSANALVFDAAAQMFWKNMAARSLPESVPATGRNPISWDLPQDAEAGTVACAVCIENSQLDTLLLPLMQTRDILHDLLKIGRVEND